MREGRGDAETQGCEEGETRGGGVMFGTWLGVGLLADRPVFGVGNHVNELPDNLIVLMIQVSRNVRF